MSEINTIFVVGAGLMGRGIAYVAALGGFTTILHDVNDDILSTASAHINASFDKGIAHGKVTAAEKESALARLTFSSTLAAASTCDFVIEAAPEYFITKVKYARQVQGYS